MSDPVRSLIERAETLALAVRQSKQNVGRHLLTLASRVEDSIRPARAELAAVLGGTPQATLRQAIEVLRELRINANRLCDRQQGGTYEEDCRRSIAKADEVLAGAVIGGAPQASSRDVVRDVLIDIVDDLEARWDMNDPRTNPGIRHNVERAKAALKAGAVLGGVETRPQALENKDEDVLSRGGTTEISPRFQSSAATDEGDSSTPAPDKKINTGIV